MVKVLPALRCKSSLSRAASSGLGLSVVLSSEARRSAPDEKASLFSQKTVNKQDEVIGTTTCLSFSDDGDDDDRTPHWITFDSASLGSFLLPLKQKKKNHMAF